MNKITAVVLTKNEKENIERCLKSLSFCNEIIVIDDYSDDNTILLAKKYNARIFKRKLNSDWAGQRNFALSKAKFDWVIFVDADEEVSKDLKSTIISLPVEPTAQGYNIRRVDYLWNKFLSFGEWGNCYILRLGMKDKGKFIRRVHERWVMDGKIENIDEPLFHYPHQTLSEFIVHINHMSTIHAEENQKEGKKPSLLKIMLFPPIKFVENYFFNKGFLNGNEAFVASSMMSFHSFLSWGKLWLKDKKR